MKLTKAVVAAAATMALTATAPAHAANFYMNGLFGIGPKYSTMTGPEGQKCDTSTDCDRISTAWTTGPRAIERTIAEHGKSGNTFWVYSKSSVDAINYLNANPDDQNTWIMSGSPSKPGNGDNRYPLTNTTADVTFITVEGDAIAQPRTGGSLSTHIRGYNHLDATQPASSRTLDGTNTKDNVYNYPKQPFNIFNPHTWGASTVDEEQEAVTATIETTETPKQDRKAEKKAEREAKKNDPAEKRAPKTEQRAEKQKEPKTERQPRKPKRGTDE